jgi:hypothetical protein
VRPVQRSCGYDRLLRRAGIRRQRNPLRVADHRGRPRRSGHHVEALRNRLA